MKCLVFLIFLLACSCQGSRDQPVIMPVADDAAFLAVVDTSLFSAFPLKCVSGVRAFYATNDFSLAWHEGKNRIPAADSLVAAIRNADQAGLIPEDYHLRNIVTLMQDCVSPRRLAQADLLLSDAFLTLYHHLKNGRLDPLTLHRKIILEADTAAIQLLEKLPDLPVRTALLSAEPLATQYQLLKGALQKYLVSTSDDSSNMERALKATLNMERWRWQKPWPERYVLVNVPSFLMRVVEHDSLFLESRVIVGKRETPTPVLESVIRSFVIYPYWHVPLSIASTEILPALQSDTAYLGRNNFEVLDRRGRVIRNDTIQWRRYSRDHFPFILRQREGSENSMGIIKFNFANNYGVYLHDTNSKRLYARRKRDLSHGCVRVNKAVDLAHYLVREDDVYVSPEDLDQYLSLQQRLNIDLRKPITVKLEYFTAEVRDGVPFFYDDIYKKDSVMMQSLFYRPDSLAPDIVFKTGSLK